MGSLPVIFHKKNAEFSTSPIELGKALNDKNFILDIAILLNNSMAVNLEMQVLNTGNWPERSLSYLCRKFDSLSRGARYQDVIPVVQVCFLDFTLFPGQKEFYSTYRMMNIKNHHLYSDKFTLSVINLKQIGAATEKDKAYHLDQWAALFKSTEWKEIQMLTQGNDFIQEAIQEAAQTMYQLSAEEIIRQQCEAREDAERVMQGILEKQERETARANAAEAKAEAAEAEAEAAKAEAETAKAKAASAEARAIAAEGKLTTVLEELKYIRKEIDTLKQRP